MLPQACFDKENRNTKISCHNCLSFTPWAVIKPLLWAAFTHTHTHTEHCPDVSHSNNMRNGLLHLLNYSHAFTRINKKIKTFHCVSLWILWWSSWANMYHGPLLILFPSVGCVANWAVEGVIIPVIPKSTLTLSVINSVIKTRWKSSIHLAHQSLPSSKTNTWLCSRHPCLSPRAQDILDDVNLGPLPEIILGVRGPAFTWGRNRFFFYFLCHSL